MLSIASIQSFSIFSCLRMAWARSWSSQKSSAVDFFSNSAIFFRRESRSKITSQLLDFFSIFFKIEI
ncbi:MAG TPA: hypothetical protein ENO07_07650 [candidate division Zixibacteria bacterium]|nr:hypothetical protein [candidate division Zixibacteria bacterium]